MNHPNYRLYGLAVATVVGALWLGAPLGPLALLGIVLICPLMTFMMRGMQGDEHGHPAVSRRAQHGERPHHSSSHR